MSTKEELLSQVDAWSVKSVTKAQFDASAERVKPLENLSNDQKLQLYGLFKQASVGNVNTSRPWAIDMVGCAKWDAWKSFEGLTTEKAQLVYVYFVDFVLTSEGNGITYN